MADVAAPASTPRRKFRLRFGLKTLLILGPLLTIGAAIGWRAWYDNYRQAWAIEQIARHGGTVERDAEQQVVGVQLPGLSIDDETLISLTPALAAFPKLEKLSLVSNAVTDEGLQQLGQLKQLKIVYLAGTKVTEQGVANLKRQRPDLNVDLTRPHIRAMKLASKPIYQHAILSLALAPDGSLMSGSGDGRLRLWDLGRGKMTAEIEAHREWMFGVARPPDSMTFATAGGDHDVYLWDWKTGRRTGSLRGHEDDVHGLAITPDGMTIVTTSDDLTVRVWDIASQSARHTLYGHDDTIPGVAIAPNGTLAASASRDHTVGLWNIETGEHLGSLRGHTDDVLSVDFHPSGEVLVSASYDGTIKVWDVERRAVLRSLESHQGWAYAARFSPDGKQIASGGADGVRLWDRASGDLLWHAEEARDVATVLWLDKTQIAAAAADGAIRLYRDDGALQTTMWTRFSNDFPGDGLNVAAR